MTKEQAIALAESGWWRKVKPEEAALFQLFEPLLCMPLGEFHGAVEKLLGRSVFTHEFALMDKPGGLREEATGKASAPTLGKILDLIPADKRIVVVATNAGSAPPEQA